MIVEQEIISAVVERLAAGVPDISGRVKSGPQFPTDSRDWPCIRVQLPRTQVATTGNAVGRRPRTHTAALNISIIADGQLDDAEEGLRQLGQRVDESLLAEPYLEDGGGKARVSDLYLASTATETVAQRGVVLAVRQLVYGVVYRTREPDSHETLSR